MSRLTGTAQLQGGRGIDAPEDVMASFADGPLPPLQGGRGIDAPEDTRAPGRWRAPNPLLQGGRGIDAPEDPSSPGASMRIWWRFNEAGASMPRKTQAGQGGWR